MITLEDYFGPWRYSPDANDVVVGNAEVFLPKVNALLDEYEAQGGVQEINPATGTQISGEQYGGFRPQGCPQGAPTSSHKEGRGLDRYDPHNALDAWITDEILTRHGLYREAPESTQHWCHLTDRPPHSGHRTFQP